MKRILVLVLSITIIMSLFVGCAQSNNNSGDSTQTPTNQQPEGQSNANESDELVITDEPYEFTLFSNWGKLGYQGEMYMNQLCEELNLKINYDFPAGSSYNDTVQLMLASGDYPDLVLMPSESSPEFLYACEDGVFMNIEEYLDSGLFPYIMKHTAEISWAALDVFKDGRIWGVPRSSMVRADGYEVRADWLEAVGIDYTEGDTMTLDELYNMLYAFTYNDPDGNGLDDTYGVHAYRTNYDTKFSEAFGISHGLSGSAYHEGWGEYDGEYMCLKYSKTNPAYKEYLAFLAKLWADGLFDPDTFTIDSSAAFDRFDQGITGVRDAFPGNMARREIALQEFNEDAELVFLPAITKEDNAPYTAVTPGTGIWYVWTITNVAEKPERILQLMDTALDDDHWMDLANRGVKGVAYDIDANGNIIDLSDTLTDETKGNTAIIRFMRRSDGPEFFLDLNLTPENRKRYSNLIDITLDNYIPSLDLGYVPSISKDPAFIDYNAEMNAQIAKIIIGDLPVDAWDDILDGWYKAGGEEYVKDMQDFIASSQNK
jgi:putative aldouronate transport system substrate-binding protein